VREGSEGGGRRVAVKRTEEGGEDKGREI